jgi:hypothetical protein
MIIRYNNAKNKINYCITKKTFFLFRLFKGCVILIYLCILDNIAYIKDAKH